MFPYFLMIEGNFADVREVGEEQRSMSLHGLAAAVVVGVPRVPSDTLAFVATLEVAAHLRAHARLQALVNVWKGNNSH